MKLWQGELLSFMSLFNKIKFDSPIEGHNLLFRKITAL